MFTCVYLKYSSIYFLLLMFTTSKFAVKLAYAKNKLAYVLSKLAYVGECVGGVGELDVGEFARRQVCT